MSKTWKRNGEHRAPDYKRYSREYDKDARALARQAETIAEPKESTASQETEEYVNFMSKAGAFR